MSQSSDPVWGIHGGKPRGQSKDVHRRLEDPADRLFKDGFIAIGWPETGALTELPGERDAFRSKVAAIYGPDAPSRSVGADAGMLFRFVHEMQIGDLIVYRSRVDGFIHVGRVVGPYVYDPSINLKYPHLRSVEWLGEFRREEFTQEALRSLRAQRSLFQIRAGVDEFRVAVRELLSSGDHNIATSSPS
ncbi:MAG: hypothetical protein H0W23_00815 [Chloroflexia bacterium]|nr:hypothetical protein [Chloroflexia bacterium]